MHCSCFQCIIDVFGPKGGIRKPKVDGGEAFSGVVGLEHATVMCETRAKIDIRYKLRPDEDGRSRNVGHGE